MPANSSEYNVNIIISTKDRGAPEVKKAVGSWTELKSALGLAKAAFNQAYQAVEQVYELMKEGAAVDRAQSAINNLAASYGESGDAIVKAIQTASNYTIDRMTAMEAANKAMLLGVAQTPDEFARLAQYATTLGRAMGKDAASSINDFVVAAGRQSKMIADNLGLMVSAEDAYKRYADANNTTVDALDDTARKQAFLTEMLRQAEEKVGRLGVATIDTAGKMEQAEAAIADMKTGVSELAVAYLESTKHLDNWNITLNAGRDAVNWLTKALTEDGPPAQMKYAESALNTELALTREEARLEGVMNAAATTAPVLDDLAGGTTHLTGATVEYLDTLALFETQTDLASVSQKNFNLLLDKAAREKTAEATRALDEYNAAIKEFSLDAGMRWKTYFDGVDEQAETFATRREQIDAGHQETLAELEKRGQAKSIWLNEEAEKEKLTELTWSLEQAQLQLSEYNDKTRESTRRAKEKQIADLQGQVSAQQKMLDDYYAGRLIATGENVDDLIAEEDRRHREAVAGLQSEIDKEKELQRQRFGTLLLDTFDTWAEIEKVPPEKMMEMRTAIAVEYGLISSEESRLLAISMQSWSNWKDAAYEDTEIVVSQLAKTIESVRILQRALASLPGGGLAGMGEMVPSMPGTGFYAGVPTPSSSTTYNFNQTVNTQATSHSVVQDFRTARALVE